MAKGIQTSNGKAFEYACLLGLYNELSPIQKIETKDSPQLRTAQALYEGLDAKMQDALDKVFNILNLHYQDQRPLWDLYIIRKWGNEPASFKQMEWIKKYMGSREIGDLTKGEAHYILNRLFNSESSLGI